MTCWVRIFAYSSSEPVSLQGKLTAMVESKHRLSYDTVSVNKLAADHKGSKTSSNGKKKVGNKDLDSHKHAKKHY